MGTATLSPPRVLMGRAKRTPADEAASKPQAPVSPGPAKSTRTVQIDAELVEMVQYIASRQSKRASRQVVAREVLEPMFRHMLKAMFYEERKKEQDEMTAELEELRKELGQKE